MKNGILTALVWCGVWASGVNAQQEPAPVYDLLRHQQALATPAAATVAQRAAVFPSLEVMPKDVDSFFILTRLNEWFGQLAAQSEFRPLNAVLENFQPESVAIGCNSEASQDLARLVKMLKLMQGAESELIDQWIGDAEPDAARTIVAQSRALQQARGEQLVALTRDFHLAPVHLVLSCKPGGEAVLKQLSVLLMMVPVEVEGPLGLLMQGQKRGFYVNCAELDLSGMSLLPEHEQQMMQNLQNKRLYLMSEVQGRHLVITLCSDINAVKLPVRASESMLAADAIAAYDDMLHRETYAVAHSSKDLVNAGREANLMEYTQALRFLHDVFQGLAPESAAASTAASALERMQKQVLEILPARQSADSLRVWKEDDWYLHFTEDACGRSFAPGRVGARKCSAAASSIFFAETTPLRGQNLSFPETLLPDIRAVHQGVLSTLKPGPAESLKNGCLMPEWVERVVDSCAQVVQCVSPVLTGGGAVLLQETGNAAEPTQVYVCADTVPADNTHSATWQAVSQSFAALPEDTRRGWTLSPDSAVVIFSSSAPAPAEICPQPGAEVPGGAVFSFNLQALARATVLMASAQKTPKARENARDMLQLAQWVECIEGACSSCDNRLHYIMRIKMAK